MKAANPGSLFASSLPCMCPSCFPNSRCHLIEDLSIWPKFRQTSFLSSSVKSTLLHSACSALSSNIQPNSPEKRLPSPTPQITKYNSNHPPTSLNFALESSPSSSFTEHSVVMFLLSWPAEMLKCPVSQSVVAESIKTWTWNSCVAQGNGHNAYHYSSRSIRGLVYCGPLNDWFHFQCIVESLRLWHSEYLIRSWLMAIEHGVYRVIMKISRY